VFTQTAKLISVAADEAVRQTSVEANGLRFGVLEAGTGPLALCLHGFPDCAHTWQLLLPELARAGFHAVAPFTRGYSPTEIPGDAAYSVSDLAADANALHDVLGGDSEAVLIGHDWGAETVYAAAASAPDRWRRLVTLAVPPAGMDDTLLGDYEQLKRFFYLFLLQDQSGLAQEVVARDDMAFLDLLWRDWSPGFDAADHVTRVKESLREPDHLNAAIAYYRATELGGEASAAAPAPQPTLFLHGVRDGCIGADLVQNATDFLAPGSRMIAIPDAGHFLHLERPAEVNAQILSWLRP
jgi:pimeloyl-ACP methyl ester carboxylesterase